MVVPGDDGPFDTTAAAISPSSDGEDGAFAFIVTEDWCVGPPTHVFLFGGGAMALALAAIRRVTGREPICATAQFVSSARLGDRLDIKVDVAHAGGRLSHAGASIMVEGRLVMRATATFGGVDGQPARQWVEMPDLPPPDACIAAAPWPEQAGGLLATIDVRAAPGLDLAVPQMDGRLRLWLRMRDDRPVDAETLALFADFVPSAVGAALGAKGGGSSIDNALRIVATVPTCWVAADVGVRAVARGMAHGDVRLFAQDGTLMAIGSQSLLVRSFG